MTANICLEDTVIPSTTSSNLGFSIGEKLIGETPISTSLRLDLIAPDIILEEIHQEQYTVLDLDAIPSTAYEVGQVSALSDGLYELIGCIVRQTSEIVNNIFANTQTISGLSDLIDCLAQFSEQADCLKSILLLPQDRRREKILQELRRLNFYRRLFSKLLVKILCLLSKTRKTIIIGKGIEGFIAYKTWARPPSKTQLVTIVSTLIDKLSRPGNAYTEMCYAS